ncbi:hypothetical protein ABZY81_34870 [Streptomyces sp. NPDC006514]|uniref:hypothetical protein n=1 Tax=Streptomyces sp. NPDC006514 TaxID=3154308 RepID=UPI0033A07D6C
MFQNQGSFLCPDARGDGSLGSAVIAWDCNGGAKLIPWHCNNGWNQAFKRHMPYQLENTPYGDAIDAPNDKRGTQTVMWGKNGGKNQRWEWL